MSGARRPFAVDSAGITRFMQAATGALGVPRRSSAVIEDLYPTTRRSFRVPPRLPGEEVTSIVAITANEARASLGIVRSRAR
jgi:hypothetical protein